MTIIEEKDKISISTSPFSHRHWMQLPDATITLVGTPAAISI